MTTKPSHEAATEANAENSEQGRSKRRVRLGILAGIAAAAVGVTAFAGPPVISSVTHSNANDSSVAASNGPLHTNGSNIVDASGRTVTLAGVNWFGFETGTFAPHGLWARNWGSMLDQMVSSGFNTIRLPYSNQMFDPASKPNGIDYKLNPDLKGLQGVALMDKIVTGATDRGLKVILDQHRPDQYGQSPLWYSSTLSEKKWISDWTMLAKRFKNNPNVIGADLHNEPRGQATWGDGNPETDWQMAAQKAGNAIQAVNPNWLIFVEGVDTYQNQSYWWGGELRGAKAHPVKLNVPNHLVYSAHDYGPGVYNQNWFMAKNFPNNMPGIWSTHWGYLKQQNIAPVLIGEFGGRLSAGKSTEAVWQNKLVSYMKQNGISYTYWSWNPDSGDTGGILKNDWKTLDMNKVKMLSTYQSPVPQATPKPKTS
jgi:endoglucanase